mgnify:CR=1 FL=1
MDNHPDYTLDAEAPAAPAASAAERTIRLQNIDPNRSQISLQLDTGAAKTAPRMRRGVSLLAVCIPSGAYYDICAKLGVDFEEARRLARSPEVLAEKRKGRLIVYAHPQSAEEAAVEAAESTEAVRANEAVRIPDPPDAVGAGVDLELAGLPPETPRKNESSYAAPLVDVRPPEPEVPAAEAAAIAALAAPEPDAAGAVDVAGPTMAWSMKRLEEHAAARGLGVPPGTSKTKLLKRLREVST